MKFNKKILIIIGLVVLGIALLFMFTDVLSPRNEIIQGTPDSNNDIQLTKYEKDNNYCISFKRANKKFEMTCTKEQYDFMSEGKTVYILFRKNFFNRYKGKVLKVDTNPISNDYRGM